MKIIGIFVLPMAHATNQLGSSTISELKKSTLPLSSSRLDARWWPVMLFVMPSTPNSSFLSTTTSNL